MFQFIIAAAPAIVLLFFIYNADTREKEPLRLVLAVMGLGAAACAPTVVCEMAFDVVLVNIFDPEGFAYLVSSNLLGVALVEEGFKLLAVYLLVWKRADFDHVFDGIVYCVAAALGFALLENILYVCTAEDVISVAIGRAILSVPGHMCDGIFMGIFVGLAKKAKYDGLKAKCRNFLVLCMLAPIAEHGIYDGILSAENEALLVVFYLFVACTYTLAFIIVLSNRGKHDQLIAIPGRHAAPVAPAAQPAVAQTAPSPVAQPVAPKVQAQREDWYCSNCGTHIPHGKFCSNCGTPRL